MVVKRDKDGCISGGRAFWFDWKPADRDLTFDELLAMVRRWQSPSVWDTAFLHVENFNKQSALLDNHEDYSEEQERQLKRVNRIFGQALKLTSEITWIKSAVRRLAPKLLKHVPAVAFVSQPRRGVNKLAEKMLNLEGSLMSWRERHPDFKEATKTGIESAKPVLKKPDVDGPCPIHSFRYRTKTVELTSTTWHLLNSMWPVTSKPEGDRHKLIVDVYREAWSHKSGFDHARSYSLPEVKRAVAQAANKANVKLQIAKYPDKLSVDDDHLKWIPR